jgi:putative glutamine amidotransferase
MPRPLIGITCDNSDSGDTYESPIRYAEAVEHAGGLPLLIPFHLSNDLIPSLVDHLRGILFTGGNDLDPHVYGQDWHPKAERIDPARQSFELALLAEVEKRRMPALGVCLGSQLMNVYRGGSMHQFLPDVLGPSGIEHRKSGREYPRHDVAVDLSTQLGRAIGEEHLSVNTYHKQAADRVGRGLKIVATSPDGVIEAFEDPAYPLFAGVQWHPERLHQEPEHLAIFEQLVKAAEEKK